MLFKYKGYNEEGVLVKGYIEALTIKNVKNQLKSKKIIPLNINKEKIDLNKISFYKNKSIKTITLANFSRDLGMYLSSNISILLAIKLLKQRYKDDKTLEKFFLQIETYLDQGENFYNSLTLQNVLKIPEYYKQSINMSQSGVPLKNILLELSDFLIEQNKIKKQITKTLIYPIFILFTSIFILIFMLIYIIPKISTIFIQLKQELPLSTQFVLKTTSFLQENYISLIIFIFSFFYIFFLLLKKSKIFKYYFDFFCLKIPYFSKIIEYSELSRFSYMNSLLIKSGTPIVQSINLSSNILKNTVLKKIFINASKSIVEGKKLSQLLSKNKIYSLDKAFIQSIALGEETSKLENILNNQAILYKEFCNDKTSILLSLLEPVLMLVIGSIIGFIIISMLQPIFTMSLG